jgi:long-chain acyl-CoA synthetase
MTVTADDPATPTSAAATATAAAGGADPLDGATSVPALLLRRAGGAPGAVALRRKELGRWRPTTWGDYAARVARVAAGLVELGVQPGDRVAIQSENRPAWAVADLAAQSLGAVSVGVYATSPAVEVRHVLGHSGAVVLVAEDEEQFDKVLEVWAELPALRQVVVVDPRGIDMTGARAAAGARAGRDLLTFEELEQRGAATGTVEWLAGRVAALDPDEPAVIVYTSGTTGPPKGAMLSQANLVGAARASCPVFGLSSRDEVLSYLPLAHIAERLLSIVDAVAMGYTVNFGEGGEAFATDLREVQPTFFLGVPRVWEKLMAGVEMRMANASRLKRLAYRAGHRWGTSAARARIAGSAGVGARLRHAAGWLVLFRPLRRKLGLARVRQPLSGAAPVAPQVIEWFWALGVGVREVYGQTENSGVGTVMPADDVRIGTVGRPYPGVEIRREPDGELLTRGPGTFVGYFADPDATAAALDADGWLRTGDIGEIDADGFVTITDRKKDIVITSGGKNVSPSQIEGLLKVSPFVREAVVVGDGRKYLVALVGIEGDTVGAWASQRGLRFTTYEDLSARPEVHELVAAEVARVNDQLASVETIKRFALLPRELDQLDGEVTATQKVKRAAIARRYAPLIDSLYAEGTGA